VYGAPLALPSQFLTAAEPPPSLFVNQLQSHLPCVADRSGTGSSTSVSPPTSLQAAAFMYVKSPLLSPGLTPLIAAHTAFGYLDRSIL
jgi:hypothetical protein